MMVVASSGMGYKRARVSLTLRLICGDLVRSLMPFLTCIYETLLDLEIWDSRVSSCIAANIRLKTVFSFPAKTFIYQCPSRTGRVNRICTRYVPTLVGFSLK